jgi:glycosyltransferase involved in cell wall biosynthesis
MSFTVTVAIPVFNRRDMTLRAVRSGLDQNVDGLDVLAIDDGSTDDVWAALQGLHDSRLRLVRNPVNRGLFGNFNRCLDLAAGRYVRILCCDDRLTPGCLAAEVALMDANPSAALLSTRGHLVRSDGGLVTVFARLLRPGLYPSREAIRAALWVGAYYGLNPFNYPSGVLLRRAALGDAVRFDERMRVAGDVDLFLRVLRRGDLLVADQVGCEILHHDGQVNRQLVREGHHLRECWQLTLANRDVLPAGDVRRFVRQLAGQALAWEAYYRLTGDREAAAAYARVRSEMEVRPLAAALGMSALVALRLSDRALAHRYVPFRPR